MQIQDRAKSKEANPLLTRTKLFAIRVMRLVDRLPARRSTDVVGKQFMRSATSIGANYRAARRVRSTAEFLSKLGIVEEEADESIYWLELVIASNLTKQELLAPQLQEADEITAMIVASIKTAKRK